MMPGVVAPISVVYYRALMDDTLSYDMAAAELLTGSAIQCCNSSHDPYTYGCKKGKIYNLHPGESGWAFVSADTRLVLFTPNHLAADRQYRWRLVDLSTLPSLP